MMFKANKGVFYYCIKCDNIEYIRFALFPTTNDLFLTLTAISLVFTTNYSVFIFNNRYCLTKILSLSILIFMILSFSYIVCYFRELLK